MERYETIWSSSIESEGTGSNPEPDPEKTSRLLKLGGLNKYIRSVNYKPEEENSQHSSKFILAIENHLTTIATYTTSSLSLKLDSSVKNYLQYIFNISLSVSVRKY